MDGGAWCRLLSMGSQRVGHDWVASLSLSGQNKRVLCILSGKEAKLQEAPDVHRYRQKPSLWPTSVGLFFFFFKFLIICFLISMWSKPKSLSCFQLFATPWTVAYQAPPSMGFSRQECWNGLLLELLTIFQLRYSLSASVQDRMGPKLSNSSKGWRTIFLLSFLTWSLDGLFGTVVFPSKTHTI